MNFHSRNPQYFSYFRFLMNSLTQAQRQRKSSKGERKGILSAKWHLMVSFVCPRSAVALALMKARKYRSASHVWPRLTAAENENALHYRRYVSDVNSSKKNRVWVWFSGMRLKLKMKNCCRRFAVVIFLPFKRQVFPL